MPSTPCKRNPIRAYSDAEESSCVAEAVQLGNYKQYCRDKSIPYSDFESGNMSNDELIQCTCKQFSDALHTACISAVKRTWGRIDSEPICWNISLRLVCHQGGPPFWFNSKHQSN